MTTPDFYFALAAAFVVGSVVGAIFHKWYEKQASDAKIRAAEIFNTAVKAALDKIAQDKIKS